MNRYLLGSLARANMLQRSFSEDVLEAVEAGSGLGILGGATYTGVHSHKAHEIKRSIKKSLNLMNKERALRDRLSKEAIKERVREGLAASPNYAKHSRKKNIGLGLTVGSGAVLGASELYKKYADEV